MRVAGLRGSVCCPRPVVLNPGSLALAQSLRESFQVLLAAAPDQLRKLIRIDRGCIRSIGRDPRPSLPKPTEKPDYVSNCPHFTLGATLPSLRSAPPGILGQSSADFL